MSQAIRPDKCFAYKAFVLHFSGDGGQPAVMGGLKNVQEYFLLISRRLVFKIQDFMKSVSVDEPTENSW